MPGDSYSPSTPKGVRRVTAGNLSAEEVHTAAALETALIAMAEGGARGTWKVATLNQVMSRAVETIGALAPQPSEQAQAAPADPVNAGESDQARLAEIARSVKQAAAIGDVSGITRAIERLPAGSAHRTRFAELADDFDLDGLAQSATELEQAGVGGNR